MKERTSSLPDLCDILIVIVYRSYLDPYSKKMKQCKIKSETWTVIKTCDAIMELWNKIDHIMKIVTEDGCMAVHYTIFCIDIDVWKSILQT